MTFVLRDRPDGQVEIIINRPVLIGIFPERESAQKVCAFLQEDEAFGLVDDAVAGFATAAADVSDALAETLDDLAAPEPAPVRKRRRIVRNLPAVVDEKPRPPVFLTPSAPSLTDAQRDDAFRRIAEGQKLSAVAPEFGLTMGQLRGIWANHKRNMQRHLSDGGQIACGLCARPFTPSLSHPDTCARCSHE